MLSINHVNSVDPNTTNQPCPNNHTLALNWDELCAITLSHTVIVKKWQKDVAELIFLST